MGRLAGKPLNERMQARTPAVRALPISDFRFQIAEQEPQRTQRTRRGRKPRRARRENAEYDRGFAEAPGTGS